MTHNVSGIWDIVQSNNYRVRVNIIQTQFDGGPGDGDLTGTAQEFTPHGTDVSDQNISSGTLSGDSFVIQIDWMNGSVGKYSGFFDPTGHLGGVTYDINNPSAQATWVRVPV